MLFVVVLLCNIGASCRVRLIAMAFQGLDNPFNSMAAHAVQCITAYPRCHTAIIRINILIDQHIKLRVVQVVVQTLEFVTSVLT